jgi:hypothetical protein
VASKPEPEIA